MADHNLDGGIGSESIEMYLLRIALLQQDHEPVPVPLLAQELSVSPVSANEMCRKLMDRDLVNYAPYKGVTLTPEGEIVAQRVIRRRRLWEVFLVERLKIEPHEAELMACRLEHVTPKELTERLADFLGHPTYSPQLEPIPYGQASPAARPVRMLATLTAGETGQVASIQADQMIQGFLRQQGIAPGIAVTVLATAGESLLLEISGRHLSIASTVAACIAVTPAAGPANEAGAPTSEQASPNPEAGGNQ